MGFITGFDPLYAASGLFVGFLVGMTGVGGGSLMTPILVVFFGVHPVTAVGTDLLYAAITKSVGTAVHGINRTVNWRIVRNLATGSIPATLITLYSVAGRAKTSGPSNLTYVIGAMLIVVAVLLIFRPYFLRVVARMQDRYGGLSERNRTYATVGLGVVLGTLVTLTSVGAGAMGVTVLLVLYPALKVTDVVGSDIVHAVPLTLIAGAGYWAFGGVDLPMLGSLLVGSIPGVIVGSLLAPRMPDAVLRPVLAATLTAVALKMLLS